MLTYKQRSLAFKSGSFFCAIFLLIQVPSLAAKTLIFESNSTQKATSLSPGASPDSAARADGAKSVSTTAISNNNANSEMFFILEQLKNEVSQLRGIVEEQAYQIRNLEQSGKRRYMDLDARVLNLTRQQSGSSEAPAGPVGQVSEVVPVGGAAMDDEVIAEPTEAQKQSYAEAYALVKNKQFDAAVDALHAFIEKYPEGELTGNAYYWLGEVYLVLPKLEQAKQAFLIVVKTFPKHRKLADSMFKLAVTYDRLLDPENSETYLELVQQKFPDSTAAKLAKNYKIVR